MNKLELTRYLTLPLPELGQTLAQEFYQPVMEAVEAVGAQTLRLRAEEIGNQPDTEIYTVLCLHFNRQLKQFMEDRIDLLIPYLNMLFQKQVAGHNCLNCSHDCQINHQLAFDSIQESHETIRTHLGRLAKVSVPLWSQGIHTQTYRDLREGMFFLEKSLHELMYLEETILGTAIRNAQTAIHAQAG